MSTKAHQIITDRIISLLEEGTVPWRKPWSGRTHMPQNLCSNKLYRGINVFLLSSMGYESPYWLTYRQVQELGGSVSKGSKASPVIFWKWLDVKDDKKGKKKKKIPFLRYYSVFNTAQCEGIKEKVPIIEAEVHEFSPVEEAEAIVETMPNKPELTFMQARAFYSPSADCVNIPRAELFERTEEYYATLFHELVHSTGHVSRLNRFKDSGNVSFGSQSYSKEELVAEMGSAFLCNSCGIVERTIDNSAAYISAWLMKLKNDSTFVVQAAAQAQKASDFILDVSAMKEEK